MDVSEQTNQDLMWCAGMVRKEGWPKDAYGMVITLQGPVFILHNLRPDAYTKEIIEMFMEWQVEEFA